jgi:hypothetical protein
VPFDRGSFLALAFLGGFLVELASAKLGEHTGFLAGSLEAAQGRVEVFAFSYTDARHRSLAEWVILWFCQRQIGRLGRRKSGILAATP